MAYYSSINLVSGDDKPELNFTIKDSNTAASGATLDEDDSDTWAPIDITNQTIRFIFRALGGDSILDTIICSKTSPYTDGKFFMQWNATTLDVDAGTYEAEIEMEDSSGNKQTVFDKLKFKVRDDF
jgi:hypothetical protein